jgi:AcrR family transcriptional regulator
MTGTSDEPGLRRPRRDMLRNRVALLAAAREVFADQGLDAPLEHIARAAGVGIGTLYRHFPTRADLIDAIVIAPIRAYLKIAEEALARPDPWDGLVHFLEGTCELEAANRGWNDLMSMRLPAAATADAARADMHDMTARIIRRAQRSGQLRPDLTPEDLVLLSWANSRIREATAGIAPGAWRRHLSLLLDGFRAAPLAAAPPPTIPVGRPPVGPASRSPSGHPPVESGERAAVEPGGGAPGEPGERVAGGPGGGSAGERAAVEPPMTPRQAYRAMLALGRRCGGKTPEGKPRGRRTRGGDDRRGN